jgi:hypothetical protein
MMFGCRPTWAVVSSTNRARMARFLFLGPPENLS